MKTKINLIFTEILESMRQGKRPNAHFTRDFAIELANILTERKMQDDGPPLDQILCLLSYGPAYPDIFLTPLLELFPTLHDNDELVFALQALQNQIIAPYTRDGKRFDLDLLQTFQSLLRQDIGDEVHEWLLRLIDQLGPQAIFFKADLVALRPRFTLFQNPHKKALQQLIDMMLKRFNP